MDHCLTCGKPFGFDRVTVGMLWWAKSCSQICADEDEEKIQQEERKKEHQSWLCSRPP
jgi:hypothetical protein